MEKEKVLLNLHKLYSENEMLLMDFSGCVFEHLHALNSNTPRMYMFNCILKKQMLLSVCSELEYNI